MLDLFSKIVICSFMLLVEETIKTENIESQS